MYCCDFIFSTDIILQFEKMSLQSRWQMMKRKLFGIFVFIHSFIHSLFIYLFIHLLHVKKNPCTVSQKRQANSPLNNFTQKLITVWWHTTLRTILNRLSKPPTILTKNNTVLKHHLNVIKTHPSLADCTLWRHSRLRLRHEWMQTIKLINSNNRSNSSITTVKREDVWIYEIKKTVGQCIGVLRVIQYTC